jgi:uncharacterized protein (DUF885 family)
MKKSFFIFFLLSVILVNCKEVSKSPKVSDGDKKFRQISENFLKGYLSWRPEMCVYLGFHEYDGKTSDLSMKSIDSELVRLKKYDKILTGLDTTSFSQGVLYDFRILRCGIRSEIFNFEDMQSYIKNPMTYAGAIDVNTYLKRNFAPIEHRIKSIIEIENHVSDLFANAKSNLADSLARPYVETAIMIADGSADFLSKDLLIALKDVKNDSLMNVLKASNARAINEIKAFSEYLRTEKLPKAHNKYALGTVKYQKMLRSGESISLSPGKILEIGLSELEREKNVFNTTARIINPNKKPVDVYSDLQKEHPTADSLISSVRKDAEKIRQFLIDKNIISLPTDARPEVTETPQYARSVSTASMDTPGPYEKKATEAFYYITPVEPAWTKKQKEDWLSMFNYYSSDITTIHEVYPGHYTQFTHLNASSADTIEKIFGSYAFIEGWAHYSEEMMVDEGYGNNGDPVTAAKYRLAQSGESLLRLCRLCVSIKTHCEGMPLKEATKFFMDNWYQGEKPSEQEALRGTFDPGYLYYAFGKLEILKLRDDYKKQEKENYSLQKFHDLILESGSPQVLFLREKILKDKNIWQDIL